MSESVYTRMREKGIVLPKALAPVGLYLPVQQTGNLVFISGQGCIEDGVHLTGRAGADVTVEEAARRAEICMKNTLAALEGYLGTLERVKKPVKILAFVAGTDDFTQQAVVVNGASQLLLDVFGDAGRHARSAIGTNGLPLGPTVEIESIFEVE